MPPEQDSVKKEKEEEQEKEKKGCVEKPIDASGERASRSRSPAKAASRGTTPNKRDTKSRGGIKTRNDQEEDESPSSSSSSSDSGDDEGYDPNALYCICRQKHNKRYAFGCLSIGNPMPLVLTIALSDPSWITSVAHLQGDEWLVISWPE